MATPTETADSAAAREVAAGFAVLGVGLAIAGCFFPPLELGAAGAFEAASLAVGAFEAAEFTFAVGVSIDVGVAAASPSPANVSVVVGDAIGLAVGYGVGSLLRFGPAVEEAFLRAPARSLPQTARATEEAIAANAARAEATLPEGIVADSRGVHGYLPKPGSRYEGSDFTNAELVAKNRAIRLEYLKESKQIDEAVATMRAEGKSSEEIGRHVVELRNQQKIAARSAMSPEEVARLEAGNIKKYGHPVGPTADKLFKDNKTWEAVIEKSTQKDEAINKLLGIDSKKP